MEEAIFAAHDALSHREASVREPRVLEGPVGSRSLERIGLVEHGTGCSLV